MVTGQDDELILAGLRGDVRECPLCEGEGVTDLALGNPLECNWCGGTGWITYRGANQSS